VFGAAGAADIAEGGAEAEAEDETPAGFCEATGAGASSAMPGGGGAIDLACSLVKGSSPDGSMPELQAANASKRPTAAAAR
jgi:hypothetical protein